LLWNIHNPDGSQPGPLSTEELIFALRRGSVSGHAWVKRQGDPRWQPLAGFDAFAELCDPEALPEPGSPQLRLRFCVACGSVLFAFLVGLAAF
jgi:hypothetical protein